MRIWCGALVMLVGCAHAPTVAPSDPESAALYLRERSEPATDANQREQNDLQLASTLRTLKLPFSAFVYFTPLVQLGPKHAVHLEAVQAVSELQRELRDDFLTPSTFNNLPQFWDAWRDTLPVEVQANITYHRARIAYRKGKLDEAVQLFEAVPFNASRFDEAQQELAMTLADERFAHRDEATLEKALTIIEAQGDALQLARINFEAGRVDKALEWYRREPIFSDAWNRALFESRPEARPALACLFVRSGGSLSDYQAKYLPYAQTIDAYTVVESVDNRPALIALARSAKNTDLPPELAAWLRAHPRTSDALHLLAQVDAELRAIPQRKAWKGQWLRLEVLEYLQRNRVTVEKVAAQQVHSTLRRAFEAINDFDAQVQRIQRGEAKCP